MKTIVTTNDIVSILRDRSVRIVTLDMENGYNGFVKKNEDGFLVVLNENMDYDKTIEVLKHELYHIILGHLEDECKTEKQMEREVEKHMRRKKNRI